MTEALEDNPLVAVLARAATAADGSFRMRWDGRHRFEAARLALDGPLPRRRTGGKREAKEETVRNQRE